MTYKKVLVDEDFLLETISTLKAIEKNSREKDTVERLHKLIKHMDSIIYKDEIDKNSLIEKVFASMKESRNKNPELESRLYILHQDLINNRITFEKGSEIFDSIMRLENYGSTMY